MYGIRYIDSLQLQRVGRTGRKREGYVHVLLAEGREETNWNKAREAYNDVQRSIVRGEQLELYEDVERLLPEHMKPECLEMVMEIEEYDRSATEKSRERTVQEPSKKRKRNNDPTRDIPPGACTSFVSVAELLVKQKVKRRKRMAKFDENGGLDDETDEEIEAGLFAPRRATSTSATSSKPPKPKLKRAKTTADRSKSRRQVTSKQKKARSSADNTELNSSQFAREGAEDSDDMKIEKGLWNSTPPKPPSPAPCSGTQRSSSPDVPLAHNRSIIDICTSAAPSRSPSPNRRYNYPTPSRSSGEIPAAQHTLLSPPKSPLVDQSDVVVASEPSFGSVSLSKGNLAQELIKEECKAAEEHDSLAWLLADSDDAGALASSPTESRTRMTKSQDSDVVEIEDSEPERESPIVLISSPVRTSGPSTTPNRGMPPPSAVPPLRLRPSHSSPAAPEPSLPVRAVGRTKKRSAITQVVDSSSPPHPLPSQKRLHRRSSNDSPSPSPSPSRAGRSPRRKKRKRPKIFKLRDTAEAARLNPWIDVEAAHSGDEVSSGQLSSPLSSWALGEGSESDRRFVTDLPATQASPSYDQSAVYRQSLLSQAPVGCKLSVPVFAAPLARSRGAPAAALPRHDRDVARSSSPAPPDEEDYYMLGSFVVDDEVSSL